MGRPRSLPRRLLRGALRGILALLLLLVGLWLLRGPLLSGPVSDLIEDRVAESTGVRLEIGTLAGSWIGGAVLQDVRVVDADGVPALREGSIRRIAVGWSLWGLAIGAEGAVESVEIEGVRAAIDLDRPFSVETDETPEKGDAADPGAYVPRRTTIRDVEIALRKGDREIRVLGLELDATADRLRSHSTSVRTGEVRFEGPEGAETISGLTIDVDHEDGDGTVTGGWAHGSSRLVIDLSVARAFDDDRSVAGTLTLRELAPTPVLRGLLHEVGASFSTADVHLALEGATKDRPARGLLEVDVRDVVVDGRRLGRVRVDAAGRPEGFRATIGAEGPAGELAIEGTGDVSGTADLTWRQTTSDLAALRLPLEGRTVLGRLESRGRIRFDEGVLGSARAEATGRGVVLDGHEVGDLEFSGRLEHDRVVVETLELVRGEDRLTLAGTVTRDDEPRVALEGSARSSDLSAFGGLLGADLAGGLEARIGLAGPLRSPVGSGEISGRDVRIGTRRLSRLELTARVDASRVEISGRIREAEGHRIRFGLTAEQDAWRTFRGSLSPLEAEIGGHAARIAAPVSFVAGTDGAVVLRDLVIEGDDVRLSGDGLRRDADGAVAGTVTIERLDLAAATPYLPRPVSGILTGDLTIGGQTDAPAIDAELRIDDPRWTLPRGARLRPDRIVIDASYRPGEIALRDLRLTAAAGTLVARGAVRGDLRDPEIEAELATERLDLARLAFVPSGMRVAGLLDLDLTARGRLSDLATDGRVRIEGGRLGGLRELPDLRDLALSLTLAPERVSIERFSARTDHGEASLTGSVARTRLEPTGMDLTLTAETGGIPDLMRELGLAPPAELAGAGRVTVKVTGSPAAPAVNVVATGRGLRWADEGPCSLALDAGTEDDVLVLRSLRLDTPRGPVVAEGRWPARLALHPFRLETAPLDAIRGRARCGRTEGDDGGGLRLDGLEAWLPASSGVRNLTGRASFDLERQPGDPLRQARGRLVVRGLGLRLRGRRRGLRDVEADLTLAKNRLTVRRLAGRLGHAPFAIKGHVDLDGAEPVLDLDVRGDRILLVDEATTRLRSDLRLKVRGPRSDVAVSGAVVLRDLLHTENIRYLDFQSRPTLTPLPLVTDPVLGRTRLDLTVRAPRGLRIANNVMKTELSADLRIRGTVAFPEVDGVLRTIGGRFAIPGVSLAIDEAEIRFRAREPLRPYIAFVGSTTKRRIRIEVTASGPPDALLIDIASDPALSREDALALLTTGVLPSELTAQKAGEALALAGASMLYDEIRGSSGIDDGEESTLSRLIREASERTEVSTDSVPGGRETIITASFRVLDWLHVQGERDEVGDYNIDVVFRVLGR